MSVSTDQTLTTSARQPGLAGAPHRVVAAGPW